jgi:hypothetical protein
MKCDICRKECSTACDYQQGRCPNFEPMIKTFPKWFLFLAACFIIPVWTITHPRQVWQQAKKDWKL